MLWWQRKGSARSVETLMMWWCVKMLISDQSGPEVTYDRGVCGCRKEPWSTNECYTSRYIEEFTHNPWCFVHTGWSRWNKTTYHSQLRQSHPDKSTTMRINTFFPGKSSVSFVHRHLYEHSSHVNLTADRHWVIIHIVLLRKVPASQPPLPLASLHNHTQT